MDPFEQAEDKIRRKKRSKHRLKMLRLLEDLFKGRINSNREQLDEIFNQNAPRFKYVSPEDRSAYNYGYMESKDMREGT